MQRINLLEILKKYDSVRLNQKASNWKEAIKICLKPLIENKVVSDEYYQEIIKRTKEYGPYYIISDWLAIPHANSSAGVYENGFSLITLSEPIKFDNDSRQIKIIIAFAATSPDIHVSEALPQIVAVFEDNKRLKKIANAKSKDEVYSIIENTDFRKYMP